MVAQRLYSAVVSGTFIALILLVTPAWSANFACVVNSDYVVRDSKGRPLDIEANGEATCMGTPERRPYYTYVKVRGRKNLQAQLNYGTYQKVRLSGGQTVWIHRKGVDRSLPG